MNIEDTVQDGVRVDTNAYATQTDSATFFTDYSTKESEYSLIGLGVLGLVLGGTFLYNLMRNKITSN